MFPLPSSSKTRIWLLHNINQRPIINVASGCRVSSNNLLQQIPRDSLCTDTKDDWFLFRVPGRNEECDRDNIGVISATVIVSLWRSHFVIPRRIILLNKNRLEQRNEVDCSSTIHQVGLCAKEVLKYISFRLD